MGYKERSEADGGMGAYSPASYEEHGFEEYRERFPEETKALSDEQIFHAVSNTDDDMNDDDWRAHFAKA